jgi:wobble nucleotide-excising tRNase
MITEIRMDAVASFRQATSLKTDKKINLIYGLNGTGKSTISNFLYAPLDARFTQCKKDANQTTPVLVYNQRFIQDNFFEVDNLKGVFSLSKENKVAEQQIAEATKQLGYLENSLQSKHSAKAQITKTFSAQKQKAVDEVWKIKTAYSGGDRVFEYCLEGLKGTKEKLFEHLQNIAMTSVEPKDVKALHKEVEALKGEAVQPMHRLASFAFSAQEIESHQILASSILGNTDSEVAALIEKLGNADWVKQGLAYIPNQVDEHESECPFCQEKTISSKFVASLKGYFDVSYLKQMEALEDVKAKYASAIENVPHVGEYTEHPSAQERKPVILSKYNAVVNLLKSNLSKMEGKVKSPKTLVELDSSVSAIESFNKEIETINKDVDAFNNLLNNRETALAELRNEFWMLMRWQYNQTMSRFESDRLAANQALKDLDGEISSTNTEISTTRNQIASAQKQTVNVDEAVDAINSGLLDLGIDGFIIRKYSETLYRVVRAGDSNDAFHSLSEGEKMMISFLYFCELCKGKLSAEETHASRIAVIDDPISSLSHIFIFSVGQLIRSVFFRNERFSQVFVLTHSLYFFYELTDSNHERRKENQRLFRISKPLSGSIIEEMKYEEIQNDYQAYWSVVNDPTQPAALIANCMRNIVEYFFNFVRKKDLNNVFLMPELQDVRFQAFYRYINRESHSLGQNIIDMKEFDYATFKDGLRLVFEKTDYLDHFKAMSKV